MNRVHGFCLAAAVVAVTLLPVVATAQGDSTRGDSDQGEEYPFSPGKELRLDFEVGGSAIITGWEESTARVIYYDRHGDLDDHEIVIRGRNGGLEITAERASRRNRSNALTFEIWLPRRADIVLRSAGGGLTLENLEGTFSGKTGGGSLTLTNVDGRVRLTTGGGKIRASDCRLDGRLTTGGGDVLLKDVIGNVEATSGGGDVRYKNVRDHDGRLRAPAGLSAEDMIEDSVMIAKAGGSIRVSEAPEGASLMTGGGRISVRHASRFVSARTGGGDIRIHVDDGWVKASTGAGDIEVEVEEGLGDGEEGIELLSGTGDITLILPADLSLELEIEIGYTRNSRRDYRIESDFDLDIERSERWEREHGSPRKYIWGSATLAGGRHLVRIRTVNGDIRLRRAK